MFTGLIEEIGTVEKIDKTEKSAVITIGAKTVLDEVKLGDSICTNGVCLTVTSFYHGKFTVDVMAETMRRSNLKDLERGSKVNLERALRLSDRLGGHMVSGHIDGVGKIEKFLEEANAVWITISADETILKYVVEKGSIAIDGVSLTVAYVDEASFRVSIIPHTKTMTTLLSKHLGDEVNLECDVVGKYVEKILGMNNRDSKKEDISMDFLKDNGFA
ncbi:riboflavin synthase [Clostridium manihotivorum]|uniref:Riboflavin synthase n=1 Tax=Clostridium manihotivorum TaxID=2320868 RepID=A0A410E297_9CLOT|nr:riboflavin synthase [Clostridium manihotivorum]QAA35413.1 riboflavin synthase [Clostridium manihotivorum]